MTIFPFTMGRSLIWDATCVNTFANSRLASASVKAGAAAGDAEVEKRRKYADLCQRFRFEPVAFETSGACGPSTKKLLREIGAQVSAVTGERRETEWLLQRCSIAVARGNAASVLLTRSPEDEDTGVMPPRSPPSSNETSSSLPQQARAPKKIFHSAAHHSAQTSRNPLDDPDLAHYLTARAPPRPADPDTPTTQELTDQLLHLTPNLAQVPGPPRPDALASYAALWAEMSEGLV